MDLTFDFINGVSFGIEYVGKDDDGFIDESCVVVDVAIFRLILWMGDYDQ